MNVDCGRGRGCDLPVVSGPQGVGFGLGPFLADDYVFLFAWLSPVYWGSGR